MKRRGNKKKSHTKKSHTKKSHTKKSHTKKSHTKKSHTKKSHTNNKGSGIKRKRQHRSSRGSSHKTQKRRKRDNLDFREVKSILSSNSSNSSKRSKHSFASRELDPIEREAKLNEYYNYAFANAEEVAERIKIDSHRNEHFRDCYPRSLYLLGLIDIKLKEAISAETFYRFHNSSGIINQVLIDKFNVPLGQIEQYTQPDDLDGNIYQWAQRNIPLNNFVLIIIHENQRPSGEAINTHALLIGKVSIDKIDIRTRPKHDTLKEDEIILVDTQVGDIHGLHNYVYNLGEAQINRYLDTYNFNRHAMSALRLRLDLADVFTRLTI